MSQTRNIAVALVGSPAVGKNSLLVTLSGRKYPEHKFNLDCHTCVDVTYKEIEYTIKLAIIKLLLKDKNEAVQSPARHNIRRGMMESLCRYFQKTNMYLPENMGGDKVRIALICFSVVDPLSFENIRTDWIPKIKSTCDLPFIIVGLKSDLRNDRATVRELKQKGLAPISFQEASSFAQSIGAKKYVEGSAKINQGLTLLLHDIIVNAKSSRKWSATKKLQKRQSTSCGK